MTINDKPLVTISMMTYNQEKYVGEALAGLFTQTYHPLEIVISDDCSSDLTWDIINEAVRKYNESYGCHTIILNRNECNLGIARNFSLMCSLAHGELMVATGGDDVSLPERVSKIADAWVKDGKRAAAVSHLGYMIDVKGNRLGTVRRSTLEAPLGAVMAWRMFPELQFPEVKCNGAVEDAIYAYRAAMLGGILDLEDKLVLYRVGSGGASVFKDQRRPAIKGMKGWVNSFPQVMSDVEYLRSRIGEERYQFFKSKVESDNTYYLSYVKLLTARSYFDRIEAYKIVRTRNRRVKQIILLAIYLLPHSIGDIVLNIGTILKVIIRRIKFVI